MLKYKIKKKYKLNFLKKYCSTQQQLARRGIDIKRLDSTLETKKLKPTRLICESRDSSYEI
jgi:hypothetical protein